MCWRGIGDGGHACVGGGLCAGGGKVLRISFGPGVDFWVGVGEGGHACVIS